MVAIVRRAVHDSYDLQRFVDAQEHVYPQVLAELHAGHKSSHWMWFFFPQIVGLGASPTARRFAISGLAEAKAYLNHPVLGQRLVHCTRLVIGIDGKTLADIFGYPDDLKFRSCMTLFAAVCEHPSCFKKALQKFCAGQEDPQTLARLRSPTAG